MVEWSFHKVFLKVEVLLYTKMYCTFFKKFLVICSGNLFQFNFIDHRSQGTLKQSPNLDELQFYYD